MTDLDPTGVWSLGTAVNNVGQVAGSFYVTAHGPAHAFMYASGRLNDLGTLKGSCCSTANDINNLGQITGGSRYPSQTGSNDHAFLYSSGQMTDLTESLGGCCSIGFAINNTGQITGSLVSEHAADAFLYSRSQVLLLGNLGRDVTGSYGINDAGQVVGLSEVADGAFHAFIYSDGKIADLNSLVELDPRLHITLSEASAINNDGQIVANGYGPTGYEQRAFLLTPVPEPGNPRPNSRWLGGLRVSTKSTMLISDQPPLEATLCRSFRGIM